MQSELEGIGQTFNRWADKLERSLITEEQLQLGMKIRWVIRQTRRKL